MFAPAVQRLAPDDLSTPPPTLAPGLLGAATAASLLLAVLVQLLPASSPAMPALHGPQRWTMERAGLRLAEDRPLVLLGTSVLARAIDLGELRRHLPDRRVVSLLVRGSSPLPVLEDLAQDQRFRGDVVFEVFVPGHWDPAGRIRRRQVLEAHRRRRPFADLELCLTSWSRDHLRIVAGHRNLLSSAREALGRAPGAPRWTPPPAHEIAAFLPSSPGQIEEMRLHLNAQLEALLARGSRVVLVDPMFGAEYRAALEDALPSRQYWDRIEPRAGLLKLSAPRTTSLAELATGDGIHLHREQAVQFTRWLGGAMAPEFALSALESTP